MPPRLSTGSAVNRLRAAVSAAQRQVAERGPGWRSQIDLNIGISAAPRFKVPGPLSNTLFQHSGGEKEEEEKQEEEEGREA